jgi:hypothetical protein
MKKLILISVILFFAGLSASMAQLVKVNPIPFYNYPLTQQYAAFQENGPDGETREKREMDVEITASSDAPADIFATVLLVKKNGTEVLGPFTVYCNGIFSVGLPKGKWGAVVTCSWDVNVSVWIEKVHMQTFNEFIEDNDKSVIPLQNLLTM